MYNKLKCCKFKEFFLDVVKRTAVNKSLLMSNALAFKIILSIFPFIIFVISLMSSFDVDYDRFITPFTAALPAEIKNVILYFMEEVVKDRTSGIISISLLIAVFSSSSGFSTIVKLLNAAYGIKKRGNLFYIRFIGIFLVFVVSFMIFILVFALMLSDFVTYVLGDILITHILKYVAAVFILYTILSILYVVSMNRKISFKSVAPGVLFTVFGWISATAVFNLYISNFSNYSAVYGAIGALFVFFYWINILSYIFLIGGNINACIYERKYNKTQKNSGI